MKSKNTSKNNSKEPTKDLFIAAFFILVFISPLFLLFSPFYESKGELSRFLANKTAQREKNEKEEFIVREIAEKYNVKLKDGLFERKHWRNIRIANEVIKIKLKETDMTYDEYMNSTKGLEFYYSQKYQDSAFKDLTRLIFINRHGYYHDTVCNIRYCPPK